MRQLALSLKNRFRVAVNFLKLLAIVSLSLARIAGFDKGADCLHRGRYNFLFLLTICLAYSIVKIVDILKSKSLILLG